MILAKIPSNNWVKISIKDNKKKSYITPFEPTTIKYYGLSTKIEAKVHIKYINKKFLNEHQFKDLNYVIYDGVRVVGYIVKYYFIDCRLVYL